MSTPRTDPVVAEVRRLMGERGLSKTELARQLGWGRMQLTRRLDGSAHLTVAELWELAAVLGVPVTQLIPADDSPAEVTA